MNTVSGLQPEDHAQLLANNVERQAMRVRLEELDLQDNEILIRAKHKESAPTLDLSKYKDTTRRLLTELWHAHDHMLSHQDIREDVMDLRPDDYETDADGSALRQIIDRARKNIVKHPGFRYEIINRRGKGDQLVERGTLQNVTNRPKKRRKSTKKRYGA
jgi:DNA-binding winged helix-turn-helix (wHTH) protein